MAVDREFRAALLALGWDVEEIAAALGKAPVWIKERLRHPWDWRLSDLLLLSYLTQRPLTELVRIVGRVPCPAREAAWLPAEAPPTRSAREVCACARQQESER